MTANNLNEQPASAIVARANWLKARFVDDGIDLLELSGSTPQAAAFLRANGVAMDVAVRVLTRPQRRRILPLLKFELVQSPGMTSGNSFPPPPGPRCISPLTIQKAE